MGKTRVRGKKLHLKFLREKAREMRQIKSKGAFSSLKGPPSLRVLCEKVIKKFKLLPERKKFTPPESFSIIGGKPLRKRSEKIPPELLKEEKRRKKERNPKSLATLCRIVIDEYHILPQCEESSQPSTSNFLYEKDTSTKKRGRPRKPPKTKKDEAEKKPGRKRGRPKKDQAEEYEYCEDSQTETVSYLNRTTFLRQSKDIRKIQIELDLNRPQETDPLHTEDDYTIEIKQELSEDEDCESTHEDPMTVQVPQATSQGIIINPAASMEIPGVSGRTLEPMAKFMTVFMDEHQIFANSIAEQLRKLPPQRALLLQLDIQTIIDNEMQLLEHEN